VIPCLAIVSVRSPQGRPIRLWAPVILIWVLLAPLAIVAAPFALIAAMVLRFNPFAAMCAIGEVLWALGGVRIDIESPRTRVLISMI
jgi:hypothetical protein